MDCYNVGPTLGCGTPALLDDGGQLLFPWCYDTYRVLDNGPLRVTVQMDFAPVAKGSNPAVKEHRIVTLDRGSNFVRMQVWYDGLLHPIDACAGFVIHEADTTSVVLGDRSTSGRSHGENYIHYADPTGDASRQNCQIYVATLFPDGISETKRLMIDKPENGNASHAVGIHRALANDEPFVYYFGSAWSQYDVRSQAEWQLRINDFINSCQHPLIINASSA